MSDENPFFNFVQIGEVRDNLDPKKLGRVKIYVDGISDPSLRSDPTGLPWSWQAAPVTFGGGYQEGSFSIPRVGDMVYLFFLYGDIDYPVYFATMPCVQSNENNTDKTLYTPNPPDWHSLSRGMPHQLEKERIGTEDAIQYEAEYPHNTVVSFSQKTGTTEGLNCTVEYDRTPGKERIQLTHKKGSYLKFGKRGDISLKSTENQYDTTDGDKFDYINGNHEERIRFNELIVVDGNRDEFVGGNEIENVTGNKEEYVGQNRTEGTEISRKEVTNVNQEAHIGVAKSEKVGGAKTVDIGGLLAQVIGGAKNESIGLASVETVGASKIINVPTLILNANVMITGNLAVNGIASSKTDVVAGPDGSAVSLKGHTHPTVGGPVPSTSPLPASPQTIVPPAVPTAPETTKHTPYEHPEYPLPSAVEEKDAAETIGDPDY